MPEYKHNKIITDIKEMFTILFITAHGIASLLANNSIAYDENHFKKILETRAINLGVKIHLNKCFEKYIKLYNELLHKRK